MCIRDSSKAHTAQHSNNAPHSIFALCNAKLFADCNADGRRNLRGDMRILIVQFPPDLRHIAFYDDGARGADGRALPAPDAVGLRNGLIERSGNGHLGAAAGEVDGAHMLHLIAHAHTVAAELSLLHI